MDFATKARLNIALYIAHKVEIKDFHNIFKILFWADREHLLKYGKKVLNDNYVVMPKGPVPSQLYDYFKSIRNSKDEYFEVYDEYNIKPLVEPDMDYISKSEIECIKNSIKNYDNLPFNHRCELSHGYAYTKAKRSYSHNISDIDIAIEGGADDELLKFIYETNL